MVAFPYLSELEEGRAEEILKKQEPKLIRQISGVFENVCAEALMMKEGLNYNKYGSWWGAYREGGERKVQEIDIMALNEKTKDAMFAECKFEKEVDAPALLNQLREKAKLVQWKRKSERFVIFAKSFSKRIDEKDVTLIDLKDLEKIFGH